MADNAAFPRIIGIDLTRSIAIFFAMLSHVWVVTNMDAFWSGSSADFLRALMALATPTFILLFGTMLEIVYRPRFVAGGQKNVAVRLFSRAIQCWLLYCVSVLVLYLSADGYSLKFSLATMLLIGVTPFTDILKFYAVVLFLAPFLLWLRNRVGLLPLVVMAVIVHAAHPVIRGLPSPLDFHLGMYAERAVTFLFGVGDAKLGGPSILHGTSLIIAGMAFGRLIAGDRTAQSRQPNVEVVTRASYLLVGSVLLIAVGMLFYDEQSLAELGDMSLRMDSDPLYFAAGLGGAIAMTSFAVIVTQRLSKGLKKRLEKPVFFGRTSLFTFAFGNMILYSWPGAPHALRSAVLQAALTGIAITMLSYLFDREGRRGGAVATIVKWIQSKITSQVNTLVGLTPLRAGQA